MYDLPYFNHTSNVLKLSYLPGAILPRAAAADDVPMKAQYRILAFFVLFYILDTTSSEAADIENSHFMDSKEVLGKKKRSAPPSSTDLAWEPGWSCLYGLLILELFSLLGRETWMTGRALLGAVHYCLRHVPLYIIAGGKYTLDEQGGDGPVVPISSLQCLGNPNRKMSILSSYLP